MSVTPRYGLNMTGTHAMDMSRTRILHIKREAPATTQHVMLPTLKYWIHRLRGPNINNKNGY